MSLRCACVAKIISDGRAAIYKGIFPEDEIPLMGPQMITLTIADHYGSYYLVDASKMTAEQKQKSAELIAPKFGLTVEEVLADMNKPDFEMPLSSEGVEFVECDTHNDIRHLDEFDEEVVEDDFEEDEDDDFDDYGDEEY